MRRKIKNRKSMSLKQDRSTITNAMDEDCKTLKMDAYIKEIMSITKQTDRAFFRFQKSRPLKDDSNEIIFVRELSDILLALISLAELKPIPILLKILLNSFILSLKANMSSGARLMPKVQSKRQIS